MKVRYEQYTNAQGEPPFVLIDKIKRTSLLSSKSCNWHENIEIQFCREGSGYTLADGKCHAFQKGDIIIVDSNSIHYTYTDTGIVYACIIVSTTFCEKMGIDHRRLSFTPLVKNERMAQIFEEICRIYHSEESLRIARLHYLMLAMLMEMAEKYAVTKNDTAADEKESAAAKKVILFIQENYREKITLDSIAKHVLSDKYTLCKLFKRITGQTIFETLNAYRCMKAAEYIADGKSVSEAANLCGFENSSFFTRTFKKYIGTLPSKITALK